MQLLGSHMLNVVLDVGGQVPGMINLVIGVHDYSRLGSGLGGVEVVLGGGRPVRGLVVGGVDRLGGNHRKKIVSPHLKD